MSSLPIRVEGADEARLVLLAAPERVRVAVRRAVDTSAAALVRNVKAKLSDNVLHVKTGRLRRSIHAVSGGTAEAPNAAVGTNVEYAAIHEFGGQTKAHPIDPKEKLALAFMKGGKLVFAKHVNHPGSRIPERSYLRSALAEESSAIKSRIDTAVGAAIP